MKLKTYLKIEGIKMKVFALKVGVHPSLFRDALSGRRHIPPKHWRKIIKLTHNIVKLEDLYNDTYPEE